MMLTRILAFALFTSALSFGGVTYTLTDLGALNSNYSAAYGISPNGNVTGEAGGEAFLYSGGVMQDIGAGYGWGVNDAGQVSGNSASGFRYSNGVRTALASLGGDYIGAFGINAAGDVAGYAYNTGNSYYHAVIWPAASTTPTDVSAALNSSYSYAYSINDSGWTTGGAYVNNNFQGFVTNGSSGRLLGTFAGDIGSVGFSINAAGQVAGYSYGSSNYTAFLTNSSNQLIPLGTLGGTSSIAIGLNGQGDAVGYSSDQTGQQHGFLYTQGGMYDLNNLLSNAAGWTVFDARGINDSGQIAATAVGPNGQRAVLLNPTTAPEPNSLVLFATGAGLAGLSRIRRRKRK